MDQLEIYIALLGITVFIGVMFKKYAIPMPLLLVIAGMIISLLPHLSRIELNSDLILDVFLPMLIYPASAQFSWRDAKANLRSILLLSVGHVFFITLLVAIVIHTLIPALGWPMAFVLGAVVSPPDDLAILAIADVVSMPNRVVTILKGESMLNDATALILFRFSLAAVFTHQFSVFNAFSAFLLVIVGETLYGYVLGHLLGELRLRIKDPILQMMVSILTPFIAYLPPEKLGGCGVLATVITGIVIGQKYLDRFSPEVRLIGISFWATIGFALQSILFLLVGLNFRYIMQGISAISLKNLLFYSVATILAVVIGRFIWVFPSAYFTRLLFPLLRKRSAYPPWQLSFIISWAGMRGGISLAAAMAIPILPVMVEGSHPRDLIIFLVFSVITATLLLQGLSLPWLLKTLGLRKYGEREQYREHLAELSARKKISKAVLHWLLEYKNEPTINEDLDLLGKIKLKIREYQLRVKRFAESLQNHKDFVTHDSLETHDENAERRNSSFLSAQINEIERSELLKLWQENKISHATRTKILQQLDHRSKHISG